MERDEHVHGDGGITGLERGLGLLSLALGIAQVAAPGAMVRLVGIEESDRTRALMRGIGAREIASGLGILTEAAPGPSLWARVGGDAMDLSLLGLALAQDGTRKGRTAVWTAAVAGVTAADTFGALRRSGVIGDGAGGRGIGAGTRHEVRESITINRARGEVYGLWRDFTSLPTFMEHLEEVAPLGDGRTRWVAKAPGGGTVEWDAEITANVPDELIAWRSLPGAPVESEGSVRFGVAPGGRGTEVHVAFDWIAPGGQAAALAARLLGEEPGQQVRDDLRRLKQMLELGEIVRSDGSPEGVRALRQAKQRPAQPSGDPEQGVHAWTTAQQHRRSAGGESADGSTATGAALSDDAPTTIMEPTR